MNVAEKAFSKEYLLTNGIGAFSSSTIGGCHTRKYHGLFVAEQPQIDDDEHVLVSAIDEQIAYKRSVWNIATHKYPNTIFPAGYKYIADFFYNPVLLWTYHLDDCIFTKEIIMPENEQALLIRYTVADAAEKLSLTISPFLAFRNVHKLRKVNLAANKKIQPIGNGIKTRLFPEYSAVCIQTSQRTEFVAAPDWYYNIEYMQEQYRGYNYSEDLFVPGHFTIDLKKGDKLILYIGLKECNSKALSHRFSSVFKKIPILNTKKDCLVNAARQFVIRNGDDVKIKAGYYWFGSWGRDTFISLPGLLLTTGRQQEFKDVIKSSLADLKNGLFPNVGKGKKAVYNSADTSLWFIWAIQQYAIHNNVQAEIWREYGRYLVDILEHYSTGTLFNIKMESDGLISAGEEGKALTWMDAVVNGNPVTQRMGKVVEINALWYNAICFCLEVAKLVDDTAFVTKWEKYPHLIMQSFVGTFWDERKQYLADCINGSIADWSIRPNQIFALSMPYSPVPEYLRRSILDVVKAELLTPKGLRTLSPKDKKYKGICQGNQEERDLAYHQGTVWPWLLGHYAQACVNVLGEGADDILHGIIGDFNLMVGDTCLNSIPEIYNGDFPHESVGAVAQAWSVAEALRTGCLHKEIKDKQKIK